MVSPLRNGVFWVLVGILVALWVFSSGPNAVELSPASLSGGASLLNCDSAKESKDECMLKQYGGVFVMKPVCQRTSQTCGAALRV